MQNHNYHTLAHARPEHGEIVSVNWCLGNTCNFSCSYCPKFLHSGSVPWIPIDTVLPFVDRLMDHYADNLGKTLYVEFTGGEVTLFKDFLRLTEALKERNQWTGIITNGSRTPRFWDKARGLIDHACFSYHHEFSDADHFIKTIQDIVDDVDIHVNIMVKPDQPDFDQTLEVAERVAAETRDITFDLQTLLVDFSAVSFDYTEEQMERIKETANRLRQDVFQKRTKPFRSYRGMMEMIGDDEPQQSQAGRFITQRENDWEGWWCAAGLENLVIDYDGTIWRGWCKQGGRLGNVRDPEIQFPTDGIVCGSNFCHCNFDIMSTKKRFV